MTASATAGGKQYAPTAPFGSWEPRPGSLLPQDSADPDRVSLRQQAATLAQQRLQQQKPSWVTAGAGPPGHLLTAPVGTYAVPTADMADVLMGGAAGGGGAGGAQGYGRRTGDSRQGGGSGGINPLCLSWDGLPQGLLRSTESRAYGSGGVGTMSESRAAAATHRSGSGAAGCMHMV